MGGSLFFASPILATPEQVMVLTHTLTPIEEQMPYHGLRASPCRPLLFVGRSAKKEPQAPPRHCMYMFYRECRLSLKSLLVGGDRMVGNFAL